MPSCIGLLYRSATHCFTSLRERYIGKMTVGPPDRPDEFGIGDEELDRFLADWEAVDRAAADVVREALPVHRGLAPPTEEIGPIADRVRGLFAADEPPSGWVRRATGMEGEPLPEDEVELLLRCTAATISPMEETGLPAEEEATLFSLEHADWAGAVISIVRAGPGADASPTALVAGIEACPEVELEAELAEEAAHLETAFWILVLPWELLGIIDRDQRLTRWGAWILPRALARAWGSDFDSESI